MFDIPTLLAKIPDEYKPMAALGIGSFMLVALVLFHGGGLHLIFIQQKLRERRLRLGRPHLTAGALLFGWSVFLMLALHLIEILIWSFALTHAGIVKHAYDAIYFCANAYTTLGMGSLDVDLHWRNISPSLASPVCSPSHGQRARWWTWSPHTVDSSSNWRSSVNLKCTCVSPSEKRNGMS